MGTCGRNFIRSFLCKKGGYPKVMAAIDTKKAGDLSGQDCKAMIAIVELWNKLCDMQIEVVCSRGCYDSVGYLKKAVSA